MPGYQPKLSQKVIDFLNGSDLFFNILDVLKKYQLGEDDYPKIDSLVEQIIKQPRQLANFPSKLQQATKLNTVQATGLAAELAGHWLLPLEAYVGDVTGFIRSWGGQVKDYPVDKIKKESLTPEKFVHDTLTTLGETVEDETLSRRLEYVLTMLVRDVRTPEDTVKVLMRSKKVGGVELGQNRAQVLVEKFLTRIEDTEIDRGPTEKAIAPNRKPQQRVTPAVPVNTPESKFDPGMVSSTESKEVKVLAKKVKEVPVKVSVQEVVDQIVQSTDLSFPDEVLKQRFAKVVESRLREVRTAMQTRAMLEETVQKGGLSIRGRQLATVMEAIEHAFDQTSSKLAAVKNKEKERYLKQQQQAAEKKKQIAAKTLDDRYTKMTGKPAQARPVPVAPQLSSESVPASQGAKPKVQDVSFSKRLAGPLEELQGIDVTAWQRLSKDPQEAALKIIDKIDLLENQSYAKRLAGIKAWKNSPISCLYFEITRQALSSGKSLSEIILARQKAKQQLLSEAEMRVILELNNRLRF